MAASFPLMGAGLAAGFRDVWPQAAMLRRMNARVREITGFVTVRILADIEGVRDEEAALVGHRPRLVVSRAGSSALILTAVSMKTNAARLRALSLRNTRARSLRIWAS